MWAMEICFGGFNVQLRTPKTWTPMLLLIPGANGASRSRPTGQHMGQVNHISSTRPTWPEYWPICNFGARFPWQPDHSQLWPDLGYGLYPWAWPRTYFKAKELVIMDKRSCLYMKNNFNWSCLRSIHQRQLVWDKQNKRNCSPWTKAGLWEWGLDCGCDNSVNVGSMIWWQSIQLDGLQKEFLFLFTLYPSATYWTH